MRPALTFAIAMFALAGCGVDRTRPPDIRTPERPRGERTVDLKDAGVRFRAPEQLG